MPQRDGVKAAWSAVAMLCALARPAPAAEKAAPPPRSIALPGAPATGGVGMDFIAYDEAHGRLWVPAGNTGSVDVIEVANDTVTRIEGFATREVEREGRKRTLGPSSVAVGDGVVFVGNRADDTICSLDAASLRKGPCVKLDSMPDAIVYVPSAREAWVTTQANDSIVILDAASRDTLAVKATLKVPGSPECFALDEARGLVYTNLEDKDRTVAVSVKARQVATTWPSACGEAGPRGLALDAKRNFLFVACTTRVELLDAGKDGKHLASLEVGEGVDAIGYFEPRHLLLAAAGRSGKLVVGQLDASGSLTAKETIPTPVGARNAVVTEKGVAYLTDSRSGAILVVQPAE